MGMGQKNTALEEWNAHWPVTLAAMLGMSAIALQSYGIGPFVAELEKAFGWSRAQVMLGVSVSTVVGIIGNFLVGTLVGRVGSRPVAIAGLFIITGAYALLGTATGSSINWMLLWVLIGIGTILIQSTVWTRVIARRFDTARGTAFAVALCGTPIASMILPSLAGWLTARYGWRSGFAGVAGLWLVVTLPFVLIFFHEAPHNAHVTGTEPPTLHGLSVSEGIRTRAFICLLISFGCFSFYSIGIATNLVPLLTEAGATSVAGLAGIMGLAGIAARLTVGWLLDRFPGNIIGMCTLLLPIIGCTILLIGPPSALLMAVAVGSFGAAIGAEMDVALYLATRHFGLKAFAALFGIIIGFAALLATFAPLVAGWLHDLTGNYDALLSIIIGVMSIGAAAILMIGRQVPDWAAR